MQCTETSSGLARLIYNEGGLKASRASGNAPPGQPVLELATLILLRNIILVVILLASTVAIIAIVRSSRAQPAPPQQVTGQSRSGSGVASTLPVHTTPPSLVQPAAQPGAASATEVSNKTWSFAEINSMNIQDRPELAKEVPFKYYCGCAGSFIPGYSSDIFARIDPEGTKLRYERQICPTCQQALAYVAWKEAHRGR